MAYIERDDRDLDLNEQSDFYNDDSMYDEIYEAESFGEIVNGTGEDLDEIDTEELIITEADDGSSDIKQEGTFGETIKPNSSKATADTAADETTADDSSTSEVKKDGLFSKAKEKLDQWTDKDERE